MPLVGRSSDRQGGCSHTKRPGHDLAGRRPRRRSCTRCARRLPRCSTARSIAVTSPPPPNLAQSAVPSARPGWRCSWGARPLQTGRQAKRSMRTVTARPPMSALFMISTAASASPDVSKSTVPKPLRPQLFSFLRIQGEQPSLRPRATGPCPMLPFHPSTAAWSRGMHRTSRYNAIQGSFG